MDDLERRVLRIVEAYNRRCGRGPTYDELRDRTGRGWRELEAALRGLQAVGRIRWDDRGAESAKPWGNNGADFESGKINKSI
ncbi:hypothetical protein [Gorillibacterium sp. sgz500922]|uniref:hypothetical protein n=1 Tax=Gorillibacterium sp. sgz500922 TaxID=3446694 RepID=UPI003F66CA18